MCGSSQCILYADRLDNRIAAGGDRGYAHGSSVINGHFV